MIESECESFGCGEMIENEERTKFVMDLSKNLITNTVEGVTTANEDLKNNNQKSGKKAK